MSVLQIPRVKGPAAYGLQPPASFDASRPAPHNAALQAAWHDGFLYGERAAYVSGWRLGVITGALVMLLLAIGAVVAARHQGWL